MKKAIQAIRKAFTVPTAQELAQREYEEAARQLLVALTERDRANASVNFHTDRVKRLQLAFRTS